MRTGATLEKGEEGLQVDGTLLLCIFYHETDKDRIEPCCRYCSFVFARQAQRGQNVHLGETAAGGCGGLSFLSPFCRSTRLTERSKKHPQSQVRSVRCGAEKQAFPHAAE